MADTRRTGFVQGLCRMGIVAGTSNNNSGNVDALMLVSIHVRTV